MTKNKEMHTFVVGYRHRWVNLLLQTWMLIDLKGVGNPICTLVLDKAFLEDEWGVPLHILHASILLSLFINNYVQFLNWLLVLTI